MSFKNRQLDLLVFCTGKEASRTMFLLGPAIYYLRKLPISTSLIFDFDQLQVISEVEVYKAVYTRENMWFSTLFYFRLDIYYIYPLVYKETMQK